MGKKEAETTAHAAGENAGEPPVGAEDTVAVQDLATQLAAVTAAKAELQDRLLRRMAEFDNFRRRVEREKSDIREFATMETIRLVLPVLDDFERALKTETTDAEFARGMELIFQRLSGELEKLGLETIPTEGQPFNPHMHHALEMRETAEAEDHTILGELQKGYNFRGKLLRPALVSVAVAPSSEKQPDK